MATFTGYYKTPTDPTVYGVLEGGQRVGFQDPNQLAQAQGGTTADFSVVKVDPTFNPAGFITYPEYQKTLTPTTTTTTPTTPTLQTQVPQTFSAQTVQQAFTNPISNDEILRTLRQQETLQQQLLQAQQPGPEVESLQQQLSGLQSQAERQRLSAQAGLEQIEGQPVPTPFITGQQAALQRQANLQLQTLASQERSIVDRLRLAQEKQTGVFERARTALGFGQQNLENLLNISRYFKGFSDEAKQESRNLLENILNFTQGTPWTQLDAETQTRITQLAADSNLPLGAIKTGLSSAFAKLNNITMQFYKYPNDPTVYRTSDSKAYSTPEQFFADGGSKNFSNVQTITTAGQQKLLEVSPGATLYNPATGQPVYTAPTTRQLSGTGTGIIPTGNIGSTTTQAAKRGYTRQYNSIGGIAFLKNGQPISLLDWIQQSGVTLDKALEGSRDPGDVMFLSAYKEALDAIAEGAPAGQVFARLQAQFPGYFVTQSTDILSSPTVATDYLNNFLQSQSLPTNTILK